jgi:hypothetical protein
MEVYDHYPHWSAPILLLPAAQQPARRFEKRGSYMICTANVGWQLQYCACARQACRGAASAGAWSRQPPA